jgi:hypothetical protein
MEDTTQMNRIFFGLMLLIMALMTGSAAFAGSLDYHSNQSVKYNMTMTEKRLDRRLGRCLDLQSAGMALIPEGFYIDLSNQALFLMPYSQKTRIDVMPDGSEELSV